MEKITLPSESTFMRISIALGRLSVIIIIFMPLWILLNWFAHYFSISMREVITVFIAFHAGRAFHHGAKPPTKKEEVPK